MNSAPLPIAASPSPGLYKRGHYPFLFDFNFESSHDTERHQLQPSATLQVIAVAAHFPHPTFSTEVSVYLVLWLCTLPLGDFKLVVLDFGRL